MALLCGTSASLIWENEWLLTAAVYYCILATLRKRHHLLRNILTCARLQLSAVYYRRWRMWAASCIIYWSANYSGLLCASHRFLKVWKTNSLLWTKSVKACSISDVFLFQAQVEAQRATQEYQRAIEILRAAKETIALAEERLLEEDSRQFDSAWQEMLNHATQRVRDTTHLIKPQAIRSFSCRPLFFCALCNAVHFSELLWLAVPGDGGGAKQDTQWNRAQRDSGQIQHRHQPHETAGEETQTHHQQVQVRGHKSVILIYIHYCSKDWGQYYLKKKKYLYSERMH